MPADAVGGQDGDAHHHVDLAHLKIPSALCSNDAQACVIHRPALLNSYLPALVFIVLGVGGRRGLHTRQLAARAASRPTAGQARAVRVRAALGRAQELPLRRELLPHGDAVHPVRHRGGLPLPDRRPARGHRDVRAGGDDRVHGRSCWSRSSSSGDGVRWNGSDTQQGPGRRRLPRQAAARPADAARRPRGRGSPAVRGGAPAPDASSRTPRTGRAATPSGRWASAWPAARSR